MLTFQEFFTKKKIDLALLQSAEPALFAEFKSDFEQMGEKSFDHSKKFWFNKLRLAYRTKDEPKPAKTIVEITEIASQAEALSSPTIEQKPAFTPRFKPALAKPAMPVAPPPNADETPITPVEISAKPAFKPRFKPGITKPVEPTENKVEEQPAVAPKPVGFKPRFNAATIKPLSNEQSEEKKEETTLNEAKPIYSEGVHSDKPKFNIKNIKTESKSEESKPEPSSEIEQLTEKPAYSEGAHSGKPKFNMKNIKPKE